MKWFNKLERKYGQYAINNLMLYIIAMYVLGLIIDVFTPGVYGTFLSLDVNAILHGQIWRLVTFIIQPPSNTNIIFIVFVLYFYYMIGTVLEKLWGAFKFNVYFFSGILFHIIAAFIIYFVYGFSINMTTYYINLALFMAFAMEQPDMEVLMFFVLPIKIKWLGIIDAVIFIITIIGGYAARFLPIQVLYKMAMSGIVLSPATATAALVSMINFIIFAILYKKGPLKNQTQKNFNKAYKTANNAKNRKRQSYNERVYNANSKNTTWESVNKPYNNVAKGKTKHRCAVCGKTELDGEDIIFRYCSKCEGDLEYCQEHLYTHIHVTKNKKDNNLVDIRK